MAAPHQVNMEPVFPTKDSASPLTFFSFPLLAHVLSSCHHSVPICLFVICVLLHLNCRALHLHIFNLDTLYMFGYFI